MYPDLQNIRTKIKSLHQTSPLIHINRFVNRSKTNIEKMTVTITGTYPNLFTAESESTGGKKQYNFQYVDILTGSIEIEEMN